jgi:predicted metalloprotease with PDZ domain
MRPLLGTLLALVLLSTAPAGAQLRYTVDMRGGRSHMAAVTLRVDSLTAADSVFQFAATAPGTYQTMNIGRFVLDLRATDARGRTVPMRRASTNTWVFSAPARVRQVSYNILDTWHTPVTEFPIYPMCGTDIDSDHALLNAHALLGFPLRRQASAIRMRVMRPEGWTVVTPLQEGAEGFEASSYDHLVDSPVLMGENLSTATLSVTGVPVRVAVYAPSNGTPAPQLAESMRSMLMAAGKFIGGLPVDRYVFLFRLTNNSPGAMGAWEHSYSSEYVFPDVPFTPRVGAQITSTAAHEFFHVVTPLNIHSEIIEHFNFVTPTPSEHLWLYEATTEWSSDKMQQEAGLVSLDAYLNEIAGKIRVDRMYYDSTYSLSKLAETSFTTEGARQYGNIYMRGAVTMALLDIRLLQLSGGRAGLRDLVRGLARDYGKSRPFPEDSLFQIIAQRTTPEILDFFTRYVRGAEHLPVREYYGSLGINYVDDGQRPRLVLNPNPTEEQRRLREAWLHGGTNAPSTPLAPASPGAAGN